MTSALEDIKTISLEEWLSLATAPSPTKLAPGQSPSMLNVWTDEKPGSVITANGYTKVGAIPSGNPVTFCINYFKTSAGTQTFVVSDNSTVWTTVDFQTFTSIITGLSSSFQLRGAVIRDKLWLTNGTDSVRTFDGTSVVVLDGSGGTPNVPKGRYISYHDERAWIYHTSSNRSAVYFSSLTDSSANIIAPDNVNAWDTADNFLQISEGDADFGTGMLLYRGYLFLFKQYSIWRLVGYDEYSYSRVKTRASTGTRFNESIQVLDSIVHFIGIDGMYVFDGDESERISDLIDPATASQTAFGFNQLQQPNQNNQFWEVTATADWNAGTVPANASISNELDFVAADDSQANFVAAVTKTNVDTSSNPGAVQLAVTSSGVSSANVSSGKTATLAGVATGTSVIGLGSYVTDDSRTNQFGFAHASGVASGNIAISVSDTRNITTVKILNFASDRDGSIYVSSALTRITPSSVSPATGGSGGAINVTGDHIAYQAMTSTDITITLPAFTAGGTVTILFASASSIVTIVATEIQVFTAAYNVTGQIISRTLDLGDIPNSLGNFNADATVPAGTTVTYYTQSSSDGASWDAAVACTNGGAIGSTVRRYLRWRADFTSTGTDTPVITAVYLPLIYFSAIHNTGGSIFSWGPLESDYSLLGQTIKFYYRTATSSVGVSSASWSAIVPGAVISASVLNSYIQFKIEILSGLGTNLPIVRSVTVNWVTGSASQTTTLQNVASIYWRNRYWLSAAGPSATSNNTILIRGKKTFKNPWMLKDWSILSFARFQDSLYGGSSTNGNIYLLDSGYSKAGAAMDSYFQTGDYVFGGFTANFMEIDVEVDRKGTWSLSVGWSVDGGNTWTEKTIDLSTSTYDSNFIKRINMNVTTTRIRFRFRTNGVDTPFEVHRAAAFYKLEVERGSIRGDYRAA